MPLSQVTYAGDGVTENRALTFPYIDEADVFVSVDGVDTAFTFASSATVTISPAPVADAVILIYRDTPRTTIIATLADGQVNRAVDYNNIAKQMLYSAQEMEDTYASVTSVATDASAAAASAAAAAASAAAAAADVALTNADVVLTNADVVSTNADVVLTNADVVTTNADAASTAADVVSAAASAAKLTGTSTTSLLIEVAAKVFTTQASKFFEAGRWLLVTSDADPTNYMHGQVTSYSGTTLTLNVTNIGGSGTLADWTITVAGTRGAAGTDGVIDAASFASTVNAATSKGTPVDADEIGITDSAASYALKKLTWVNVKATLKTYFDTLYAALSGAEFTGAIQVTTVEVGHATDTTLSRSAAGKVAVEGVDVALLSGAQTLTGKTLTNPTIDGVIHEEVYTITDGAGFAIDPTNGTIQTVTLGDNRTPVASNWTSGDSVTLRVADGTAYAITWTTIGVVWVGGTAPTLNTSGYTIIELWRDGSTYYGTNAGDVAS